MGQNFLKNAFAVSILLGGGYIFLASRHEAHTSPQSLTVPGAQPQDPTREVDNRLESVPAQEAPQPIPLPPEERGFIFAIDNGANAYNAGSNDMAKGASRPARAHAICAAKRSSSVHDWIGTVDDLSSTSDGKGVLIVRISDNATLSTTNNGLSESLSTLKTLIDPASSVFTTASNLKKGDHVRFSGYFERSNTDCFTETSLTQEGSMTDPEFLFQFTAISPL